MKNSISRLAMVGLTLATLAGSAAAQRMADSSSYVPPLAPAEEKFLRGFSDANILGHLYQNDSMEVGIGQAALRRSRNDAVLNYAKLMVLDHTTAMKMDKSLGKSTGVGLTMIVGEMAKSHMGVSVDSVDIASDLTVDRHYVMSQVEMHQHMLAELRTLREVAQNQAIREQIDAEIPAVREHLAKAHAIARKIGFESRRKA